MKSCDVRDELIRVLRLDLIGPEPESAHEREELFAAEDESGADDADVPERSSARKVFLPSSASASSRPRAARGPSPTPSPR